MELPKSTCDDKQGRVRAYVGKLEGMVEGATVRHMSVTFSDFVTHVKKR